MAERLGHLLVGNYGGLEDKLVISSAVVSCCDIWFNERGSGISEYIHFPFYSAKHLDAGAVTDLWRWKKCSLTITTGLNLTVIHLSLCTDFNFHWFSGDTYPL